MSDKPLSCVLLADRHHGLSEGVRGLLATAFSTVVMVADEASLLEGAGRLEPDVAVVDLSLAQDGGLDWLRPIRERCPGLKVLVLSVHDEQSVRRAALEAGADAVVRWHAARVARTKPSSGVRTGPSVCHSGAPRGPDGAFRVARRWRVPDLAGPATEGPEQCRRATRPARLCSPFRHGAGARHRGGAGAACPR
jgi:CheY-like chemotaxis protein